MKPGESDDLEKYLSGYEPKSLSAEQWAAAGREALDLARLILPSSEGEAKNLLGALTRYLARMGADEEDGAPPLTSDGIERFIGLERTTGAEDGTLGRVSRQLRRLLAASRLCSCSDWSCGNCRPVTETERQALATAHRWVVIRRRPRPAGQPGDTRTSRRAADGRCGQQR